MSAVKKNKKSKVTFISRPELKEKAKANPSTGPTTSEGKCISSGNSTVHGCTAYIPVVNGHLTHEAEARIALPDENYADWEALKQNWQDEYLPETLLRMDLVIEAAVADWLLRRNHRRYNDVEHRLYTEQHDATLWTPEQHASLERFLRYLAKAERAFYRARNALEQLRRERKKDNERAADMQAKLPPKSPSPKTKDEETKSLASDNPAEPSQTGVESSLIQCITVQVLDGKTLTIFQPRSENLSRIILTADEPKPLVKRALYFLHGIPDEYAWVTEYDDHNGRPHLVITRTSAEALQDLERERLGGGGHVLKVS